MGIVQLYSITQVRQSKVVETEFFKSILGKVTAGKTCDGLAFMLDPALH